MYSLHNLRRQSRSVLKRPIIQPVHTPMTLI